MINEEGNKKTWKSNGPGMIAGALLLMPALCSAVDYYVDPVLGVDNLVCDLANPCQTIRHTVTLTVNGDIVHLEAGTYQESGITINTDINIRGAGRINTFIEPQSIPNRVFNINSTNVMISRLTIQNGNVYDVASSTFENGGAIRLNNGSLLLSNVNVRNNDALAGGAIDHASSGYLYVLGSSIQDNWASALGGAIHCDNCGGVFTLFSAISDNTAGSEGGAIYMESSDIVSVLSGLSHNDGYKGGAISALGGAVHVFSSKVANNVSRNMDGGAIFGSGTGVNIQNSTFSGNDASNLSNGGAIALTAGGWLTVANSTFSSNIAHFAGAISLTDKFGVGPIAAIHSSTFYANTGNFDTNHISLGSASSLNLNNVIVAGGGNSFADECSVFGAIGGGDNLIDDGSCGFPVNPVTNLDTTLSYNGGVTKTHNLLVGSNAIDAGNSATCTSPYTGLVLQYDQRARPNSRIVGVSCDIGAIEVQ